MSSKQDPEGPEVAPDDSFEQLLGDQDTDSLGDDEDPGSHSDKENADSMDAANITIKDKVAHLGLPDCHLGATFSLQPTEIAMSARTKFIDFEWAGKFTQEVYVPLQSFTHRVPDTDEA